MLPLSVSRESALRPRPEGHLPTTSSPPSPLLGTVRCESAASAPTTVADTETGDTVAAARTAPVLAAAAPLPRDSARDVTDVLPTPMSSPDASDEIAALVRAAQGGEDGALDELLTRIHPSLWRYCRAKLPPSMAEDVCQEVCINVVQSLPRYRDEGRPFLAWVFTIASRRCADAWRAAPAPSVSDEALLERPADDLGPEDALLQAERAALATSLLASLPQLQREVVYLRVAAGLSASETGAVLEMSPGAVRVAQHRAMERLRARAVGAGVRDV